MAFTRKSDRDKPRGVTRGHSLYYDFLMNIINLPIDVMVAKEVVEKQVVEEEGCLVLLRKNCRETRKKNSFP